jgi:NADPH:quinone reductase-like Zn-dependent oxidoreductase
MQQPKYPTFAVPPRTRFTLQCSSMRDRIVAQLVPQVASGALQIRIARTFPLAAAAEAQAISEAGHAQGKLVLTVP